MQEALIQTGFNKKALDAQLQQFARMPREKAAAAIRCFVLLTVALMAVLQTPPPLDLLWVIGIGSIYIIATTFLPLERLGRERIPLLFTVTDIGFITALIYHSGGVQSDYYLLYYLPILNAAMRLRFRDAVGAAVLAAVCYVLIAIAHMDAAAGIHLSPRTFAFGGSSILLAGFFAHMSSETRTYEQLSQWYRQANEQKTQFVSEASHELRTPLTAILGFSELLCYQELHPEKQQEFLGIIKNQAELLAKLVENILEMYRLDAERITPQLAPVDVQTAIHNAIKSLKLSPEQVHVSLASNLPPARFDPRRFEQILRYLLENAVRFSGDKAVHISAQMEHHPEPSNNRIDLRIRDYGPGIASEDFPNIFQMFYMSTNNAGHKGTGLSLAIAQRLVELHEGELWAESTPGDGATFGMRLPMWADESGVEGGG